MIKGIATIIVVCVLFPFILVGGFFLGALLASFNILLSGITGYVIAKILLWIAPNTIAALLSSFGITIPLYHILPLMYVVNSIIFSLYNRTSDIKNELKNTFNSLKDNL